MVLAARSTPPTPPSPSIADHAPVWPACVSVTLRDDGPLPNHQAFVQQPVKRQVSSATTTSRQLDQRCDEQDAKHASVPLRRVRAGELRVRTFSTNSRPALRAAACGGRPRAGSDTTVTGQLALPSMPRGTAVDRARAMRAALAEPRRTWARTCTAQPTLRGR
jgi:hypothetical protein